VMPRQRVQHLDWLGGRHCSWRWQAKARRAANGNEGARDALEQKQGARGDGCLVLR
jgi:hypothetical protein